MTASRCEADGCVADIRRWMGEVPMPPGYHWELVGDYLQQQEAENGRGDKTPLEVFIAGVRAWEVGVRRNVAREWVGLP
jgi:hypothetical protein